jgi:hypothetical protein
MKLRTSLVESAKHIEQCNSFIDRLKLEKIQEYEAMVLEWEADHSRPTPYATMSSSKCLQFYVLIYVL